VALYDLGRYWILVSAVPNVFQVKICGVTSVGDALAACAAGADALGLNLFSGSKRYVIEEEARRIASALPAEVLKVGVFVNAEAAHVRRCAETLHLDLVQLHGDEPPEYLAQLAGQPVLKAFRLSSDGLASVQQYLNRCRQLDCLPAMVLLDAFQAGEYGGTGLALDWPALADWRKRLPEVGLVLAGGLTPENVAQAIQTVRPSAVDTASGVETAPGIKDPAQMQAYITAARQAFGNGWRGQHPTPDMP
jgi:phosphoribosylanthranilate isomerase